MTGQSLVRSNHEMDLDRAIFRFQGAIRFTVDLDFGGGQISLLLISSGGLVEDRGSWASYTAFTPAGHGERRIAQGSENEGKVKIIVSSWLRLSMVSRSESETDDVVILVVGRMDFGMAEVKDLVVEYKKSHHPHKMIKAPDCNGRPNVRREFVLPDYDMTDEC